MPPTAFIVLRAWIFFSELGAWVLAVVMAFRGELPWAAVCAVFGLGADVAGRVWSRRSPNPMPYFMRWVLLLPRGPHSPKNLERVLQPRSGERILEIGPGVGVHALPIASSLLPNGVLDVLDVQQDMLDNLARRAARIGLTNIVPKQGDAQKLPYPDRTFDAAYLIGVLGEIPDPVVALCELKRVLKPGGRLVISEILIDPDFISQPALQEKAGGAGFVLERSAGPAFAYSAVLTMKPSLAFKEVTEVSGAADQNTAVRASRDDSRRLWLRNAPFVLGDALFLLLVSVVATTLMHLVHELGWNLAFTLICGMAVAMLVQMLLAFGVAPILGSIESMVPSMVVAMISPMAVCTLDLLGFQLHWRGAVEVGVAVGLIMFLLIGAHGFMCRRWLRRAFPCG